MFSKMSLNRILVLFSCRYYASSKSDLNQQFMMSVHRVSLQRTKWVLTAQLRAVLSNNYIVQTEMQVFILKFLKLKSKVRSFLGWSWWQGRTRSFGSVPSLPCSSWYTCSWCPRNCGKYIENLTRNQATLGHRVESQERSPSLSWRLMQTAQGQPSPPL